MRTNLVGRSRVSAITHTPASGPFAPETVPLMSFAPTCGDECDGDIARSAATDSTDKPRSRRRVFIADSSFWALADSATLANALRKRQRFLTDLDTHPRAAHLSALTTPGNRMRIHRSIVAFVAAALFTGTAPHAG